MIGLEKTPWALVFAIKTKPLIRFILVWNICILPGILDVKLSMPYVQYISFMVSGALLLFVCMSFIWSDKARTRWLKCDIPPIPGFTWVFFFVFIANGAFFSGVVRWMELILFHETSGDEHGVFLGLLVTVTEFFLFWKKVKVLSSKEKNG